jgi:hypothetical protein
MKVGCMKTSPALYTYHPTDKEEPFQKERSLSTV